MNKSKLTLIIIGIFFISAIGLKVYSFYWPSVTVKLAGEELNVLVAKTSEHLFKGLGGREKIEDYDGMLFLMPSFGRHGIVMRDMLFPLDVVWFNGGVVVDIAPNIPIESGVSEKKLKRYYPREEANTILELPGGWVSKHELKIGDKLEILE